MIEFLSSRLLKNIDKMRFTNHLDKKNRIGDNKIIAVEPILEQSLKESFLTLSVRGSALLDRLAPCYPKVSTTAI